MMHINKKRVSRRPYWTMPSARMFRNMDRFGPGFIAAYIKYNSVADDDPIFDSLYSLNGKHLGIHTFRYRKILIQKHFKDV